MDSNARGAGLRAAGHGLVAAFCGADAGSAAGTGSAEHINAELRRNAGRAGGQHRGGGGRQERQPGEWAHPRRLPASRRRQGSADRVLHRSERRTGRRTGRDARRRSRDQRHAQPRAWNSRRHELSRVRRRFLPGRRGSQPDPGQTAQRPGAPVAGRPHGRGRIRRPQARHADHLEPVGAGARARAREGQGPPGVRVAPDHRAAQRRPRSAVARSELQQPRLEPRRRDGHHPSSSFPTVRSPRISPPRSREPWMPRSRRSAASQRPRAGRSCSCSRAAGPTIRRST